MSEVSAEQIIQAAREKWPKSYRMTLEWSLAFGSDGVSEVSQWILRGTHQPLTVSADLPALYAKVKGAPDAK